MAGAAPHDQPNPEDLLAKLAWRGISGWPLAADSSHD